MDHRADRLGQRQPREARVDRDRGAAYPAVRLGIGGRVQAGGHADRLGPDRRPARLADRSGRRAAAPAIGSLAGFSRAVIALAPPPARPAGGRAGQHRACGVHSALRAGGAGPVPQAASQHLHVLLQVAGDSAGAPQDCAHSSGRGTVMPGAVNPPPVELGEHRLVLEAAHAGQFP
jgi:hypothetical protein